MNQEQIKARLAVISARLEEISASDEVSDELVTEMDGLNTEFETLDSQLSTLEKAQANLARSKASSGRKTTPTAPTSTQAGAPNVTVGASASDKYGGFKSSGDFLKAVRNAAAGDIDPKLFRNGTTMMEKNGEDGGFAVPEDISTTIIDTLTNDVESFWAKATTYKVSGNSMRFKVDEVQPWNSGIKAYWIAEGEKYIRSKANLTEVDLRLHKLGAMVECTEELLEDAVALESYIRKSAPKAIMYKVNSTMFTGNGAGKPDGILNSPFTITVAKESGQGADTITPRNVIEMYSRLFPQARAGAAWYVNAGVESQLWTMKDDNGNFIYLNAGVGLNASPYATLMGLPVIPMMYALPQLGDAGDIVLANFSYYFGIEKASGVKQATSIHLKFDQDITSFKFTLRLDGKVPFKTPVTTEFGAHQMSAFVKLADRA